MSRAVTVSAGMLSGGRDLTEPRLSPDGTHLAFVSSWASARAIVLVDLAAPVERVLTTEPAPAPGRGRGGGCFAWLPDGTGLVYAAADGGLWYQPIDGAPPTCLVPGDAGAGAVQAPAVRPDGAEVVFVRDQASVWVVPVEGGSARRLDDGRHEFCLDPVFRPDGTAVSYQAWSPPDMAWDGAVVVTVGAAEPAVAGGPDQAWQQPRYTPDGELAAVHDASGWLNVHVAGEPVLAEPYEHAEPTWGPGQASYAISPDGGAVVIARNERGFGRLVVVDRERAVVTEVGRGVHGALSWAGDRVAALRSGARTPTQVVTYDTATWERQVIAIGPALGWDAVALVEPELVTGTAGGADETDVPARLYRPPGPARGLLCWIHGGPTGQWPVEFLPRVAYWVDRGWNVLVPDPRGSTGHGRAHQQALRGGWGDVDVADTAAVLAAAQAAGAGTPATTVAVGGSSGGLTALALASGPGAELIAGAIAAYPVTDLAELAARSHRYEAHYTDTLVSPDPAVLAARSRRGQLVRRPLLITHGTADPVVPFKGTVAFVDDARSAGVDVVLELFEGEGHGYRDPIHRRRELELMASFLDRVTAPGAGPVADVAG